MNLRPGKGFFGDATQASMDFLASAFDELAYVFNAEYSLDGGPATADDLIDAGEIKLLIDSILKYQGWVKEVDDFGYKAYKQIPWGTGAYRVTAIFSSKGTMAIDIRSWFDPTKSTAARKPWEKQ